MSDRISIAYSQHFLATLSNLPNQVQSHTIAALTSLSTQAQLTNIQAIPGGLDPRIHALPVGDYLLILLDPGQDQVRLALYIARPNIALEWARDRKVNISPQSGGLQIVRVPSEERLKELADTVVTPPPSASVKAQEKAAAKATFEDLSNEQLLDLGAPAEVLDLLRSVYRPQDLAALGEFLSGETLEALQRYSQGESYQELLKELRSYRSIYDDGPSQTIDPEDVKAALDRPSSGREFKLLTEDEELQKILHGNIEAWRVWLHPSQTKLSDRKWSGPVRVTGGAGTGKTVVAMHRAKWLAQALKDKPGTPILVTTYTKVLAQDLQSLLQRLLTPEELSKVQVISIDKFISDLSRKFQLPSKPLYDGRQIRDLWESTYQVYQNDLPDFAKPQFLEDEYHQVVLAQNCTSASEYMKAKRVGRGGALSRVDRKRLWDAFVYFETEVERAGFYIPDRRCLELVAKLQEVPSGIHAVIVDESQDLSPSFFKLLRALVPENPNDIFLVGDAHQRIYRNKVVLSHVGIKIQGRSHRLKINYRTTEQIRAWATETLKGSEFDNLDGEQEDLKGYVSKYFGNEPEIETNLTLEEQIQFISNAIEANSESDDKSICIVARSRAELEALEKGLDGEIALFNLIKSDAYSQGSVRSDDQQEGGVRLATMHRVKGLEFDWVIIANYDGPQKCVEKIHRWRESDAGTYEQLLQAERSLLHVAATRAKRRLTVLYNP